MITVGVTGMIASDSPAPGLAVIRSLRAHPGFTGRIVGLVDVELYTKELIDLDRREDNDTLFQLIGVHLTQARQTSPLAAFRLRFPWLLCNVVGGLLKIGYDLILYTSFRHVRPPEEERAMSIADRSRIRCSSTARLPAEA